MTIVGGLRDRLVLANVTQLINDSLDSLGWFDSNNALRSKDLTVRDSPIDDDTELSPNIVTISFENISSMEAELGSDLSEFEWEAYVDIYAEDHATGLHLSGDIRAILEGRLHSIGRIGEYLDIYNFSEATPSVIFSVEITGVESNKQRFYNKSFQKYWWTIAFQITDIYANDID